MDGRYGQKQAQQKLCRVHGGRGGGGGPYLLPVIGQISKRSLELGFADTKKIFSAAQANKASIDVNSDFDLRSSTCYSIALIPQQD